MNKPNTGQSFKVFWWILILIVLMVFFGILSGGLSIFFDPSPEANLKTGLSTQTPFPTA